MSESRAILSQMTYKELLDEYDRCLRALRHFPSFTPGSSAESNRERNALHHRIAEIVRTIGGTAAPSGKVLNEKRKQ